MHPMVGDNGVRAVSPQAKVMFLTEAFRERFTAEEKSPSTQGGIRLLQSPLPPFRAPLPPKPEPIQYVELIRAIQEQASGKAPGADGIDMEIYKKIPAMHPEMLDMFNEIYRTGVIPHLFRLIHMVPIPKPGKDPGNPRNRRPISLICTGVKISEQIIYNRIIHAIEPKLYGGQYAYRRSLSTEHHLTMLMDFVHRALLGGRCVYVAS